MPVTLHIGTSVSASEGLVPTVYHSEGRFSLAAFRCLEPRWDGFIAIDQIIALIGIFVPTVLALCLKLSGTCGFFGKNQFATPSEGISAKTSSA